MKIIGEKKPLLGGVSVPGDKSISHRSIILGALAEGETQVTGFLAGEDCISTIECFQQLGVKIRRNKDKVSIQGVGLFGLQQPKDVLFVGNSGTTIRILSGILAAQPFVSVLDGDQSIRKRPMKRVIDPLAAMGAMIFSQADYKAPLIFKPAPNGLVGAKHNLKVASAQVKSAILLAGLYSKSPVSLKEPSLSRDHTERMLNDFGVKLDSSPEDGIFMPVGQKLTGCMVNVPGDISSAAFILAAAAIRPGSCITVKNVGLNQTRTGIIDVLKDMGADLTIQLTSKGAEPIGDITLKYKPLQATNMVCGEIIPRLVDEIPIIAVLAATAKGKTTIKDAAELRVKESDRISLVVKGLQKFGVEVQETEDGMVIVGQEELVATDNLETAGDHRMAMSFAVAGLIADGQTSFADDACIAVSFPQFAELLKKLGANIAEGVA